MTALTEARLLAHVMRLVEGVAQQAHDRSATEIAGVATAAQVIIAVVWNEAIETARKSCQDAAAKCQSEPKKHLARAAAGALQTAARDIDHLRRLPLATTTAADIIAVAEAERAAVDEELERALTQVLALRGRVAEIAQVLQHASAQRRPPAKGAPSLAQDGDRGETLGTTRDTAPDATAVPDTLNAIAMHARANGYPQWAAGCRQAADTIRAQADRIEKLNAALRYLRAFPNAPQAHKRADTVIDRTESQG